MSFHRVCCCRACGYLCCGSLVGGTPRPWGWPYEPGIGYRHRYSWSASGSWTLNDFGTVYGQSFNFGTRQVDRVSPITPGLPFPPSVPYVCASVRDVVESGGSNGTRADATVVGGSLLPVFPVVTVGDPGVANEVTVAVASRTFPGAGIVVQVATFSHGGASPPWWRAWVGAPGSGVATGQFTLASVAPGPLNAAGFRTSMSASLAATSSVPGRSFSMAIAVTLAWEVEACCCCGVGGGGDAPASGCVPCAEEAARLRRAHEAARLEALSLADPEELAARLRYGRPCRGCG